MTTDRVTLRNVGETALEIVGSANPNPSHVEPGELVEVDGWAAAPLAAQDGWQVVTDEQADDLRGKALDDALEAAGLPTSGTVAEKRARLAEAHAIEEHLAQPDGDALADPQTPDAAGDGENDEPTENAS